jgi:hypothetical protein
LHAAWIGHSTVFLSIDGFTIITDPVFSAKIGINFGQLGSMETGHAAPGLVLSVSFNHERTIRRAGRFRNVQASLWFRKGRVTKVNGAWMPVDFR